MQTEMVSLNKIKIGENSRLAAAEGLEGLMESMKETGLLEPIGVTKAGTKYTVLYGNRRFLAASKLGWAKIPAVVVSGLDEKSIRIANLAENIQRRDISIAEAGRYFAALMEDGLTKKEISVRLGVANKYVDDCVKAFQEVPEKFRADLDQQTKTRRVRPGKISISTARKLLSSRRNYKLTKKEIEALFEAAKTKPSFRPENVGKYVAQLRSGNKNFTEVENPVRHMAINFVMDQDEYESITDQWVTNGPFQSVSGVLLAVLRGEKAIKVKTARAKYTRA